MNPISRSKAAYGLALASWAIACLAGSPARAAFEPRGMGARALALGSAFVAGEDDVTLVYWNPAALSTLRLREVEFTFEDLYSQGLVRHTDLSFAYSDLGPGGFGLSWSRLGVTNKVPFDYSENTYTFAYGFRLPRRFSLGTSLSYYKLSSTIKGSALGAGLAARYRLLDNLTLAGVFQNLLRTSVRYDSGAEDELPQDLRAGLAWRIRKIELFGDVDRFLEHDFAFHSGIEMAFVDALHLRGGVSRRFDRDQDWIYAMGFGLNFRLLSLDYAFENHFDLGGTHVVSLKWRF